MGYTKAFLSGVGDAVDGMKMLAWFRFHAGTITCTLV